MLRRTQSTFRTVAAAALALLAASSATARADIAVSLESDSLITSGPLAGNYLYTYSVVATGSNQVRAGDFFTVYDFGDFVKGTAKVSDTTSGFSVVTAPIGTTPNGVEVSDNPEVTNLSFFYKGPTLNGVYNLGRFTAVSSNGTTTSGATASVTSNYVTGAKGVGVGSTLVPLAAPEPTTLLLGALAVPFAWRHFKRRRRITAA